MPRVIIPYSRIMINFAKGQAVRLDLEASQREIIASLKSCDASRGSPRFLAAQRTLARNDKKGA